MTTRSYEELSKAELLGVLAQRDAEHARVVHDLEVHQVELELQNRELREIQEQLAVASDKYRELYDFAPIGYCTLDPESRITEINLRAAQLLRAPRDELLGRSLASRLPRESRPKLSDHVARCRRERSVVTSELSLVVEGDHQQIVQMVSEPVFSDLGDAIAFRTSFVDISPLKVLEHNLMLLSRAGEALASVLDSGGTHAVVARLVVPALADICMIDLVGDGGHVERVFVEAGEPGKGAPIARLRTLEEPHGWKSPQQRVIESGEPMLLEHIPDSARARWGQGEEAAAFRDAGIRSLMIVPLSARGRVLGTLTLAVGKSGRVFNTQDLELARGVASRAAMALDNVRLYEQARDATAARDATLAVVAHDLRNPLQTILLHSSLLKSATEPAPSPAKSGTVIHRAAQRMNRLIADLVDLSSLEAGRFHVEMTRHSLADCVRASVEAHRQAADTKSIALTCEIVGSDAFDIDCDPDRIEQVLANLIGNALKFTHPSGAIRVRAERHGEEVWLSVTDTGPGIPPTLLPHVFDRYWQAPDTARLGHGLGLAIAKAIVEAHHGRIWVDSEIGVGSTFHVALPALQRDEGNDDEALEAPAASSQTILVVDDDEALRDVLCVHLERAGYQVEAKADGTPALAYLREHRPPSLILLDLSMPVMDGWALLDVLQHDEALARIPVLVLSGNRDVAERLSAQQVPAITKPVVEDQLIQAVRRALVLHPRTRDRLPHTPEPRS